MSASDSAHRIQHTGLVTQQRRLRHLSSLSARNIMSDGPRREKESLMETYFTLHIWPSRETVYTSEKIHNSLNPTWRSFDLQMSCPNLDTSKSTILVRLWGGQTSDCSLVIEWLVDLRGLCYLGSQIHKDGVRYQPNSIIFGMFQGFYGAQDNLPESSAIKREFRTSIEVEQTAATLSYKIFSLGRLHTTQRAIRQTEASVSKVRSSIVEKLTLVQKKTALRSEMEALQLRLSVLKYEQEQQDLLLAADCQKCTTSRASIDAKAQDLRMRRERLQSDMDELKQQNQVYQENKEQLHKLYAQHTARKTTLLGELSDIYPIVVQTNQEHTILGIKLPNAERYSGTDDMVVSTGLGHTCHLILMMSQILKLPLRYPMIHYGSRSLVRDHITESLSEKDRDFPLYSRGKERFQFNYALYLLNRNIAQLRFAMGLQTTDLRATLPNLKSLLELKWGIKNNTMSTIYQAPRSLRQPDQPEVSARQQYQQQRRELLGIAPMPSRVTPYPVQLPPLYSQVDSAPQAQRDTPPPPYQPVEVDQTPPLSPYTDQNSPFEDLTPETEPPAPSSPIPIPSVDMAAKAIEAKQAMIVERCVSDDRTVQTTAVIEAQVDNLSLEDTLSDSRSAETIRPGLEYREKENSSPSNFVEGNAGSTLKTDLLEPLGVEQVQILEREDELSGELRDKEHPPEPQQNPLQEMPLRTLTPESEPEQVQESLVLPEFAPSGQLNASEHPAVAVPPFSAAATELMTEPSATNGGRASPTNTNNHHSSGSVPGQLSALPQTPTELTQSHSASPKETLPQTLGRPVPSQEEPQTTVHSTHSTCHHDNESVAKLSKIQPVGVLNPKLVHQPQENLYVDEDVLSWRSATVSIPPRENYEAPYSVDAEAGYQFDDLGSRAEALSRQDSFSSFKKVSTSPAKGRKSGKV